jgi:multidrug efflux pump subunit AcrA (membrane-fusion protein)
LRLKAPANQPPPVLPSPKRGIPWGKYIYLLLLLILGLAAARWSLRHFSLIQAPGIIEGKKTIIEAPLSAKIERMEIQIGDKVEAGQELILLDAQSLRDQITQQESELKALKAAYDGEQRAIPLLLKERNNELLLRQNATQHDRQRLMGEIQQLQLRLTQLNNKRTEQKRLLDEGRRLLQLGAITSSKQRDIKRRLQELEDEISSTNLKLQTRRQELVHVQHTLSIIKQNQDSLPQHIRGKSSLPVLEAKLAAASQQLGAGNILTPIRDSNPNLQANRRGGDHRGDDCRNR